MFRHVNRKFQLIRKGGVIEEKGPIQQLKEEQEGSQGQQKSTVTFTTRFCIVLSTECETSDKSDTTVFALE